MSEMVPQKFIDLLPLWVIVIIAILFAIHKYGNWIPGLLTAVFQRDTANFNKCQEKIQELQSQITTLAKDKEELRIELAEINGYLKGLRQYLSEKGFNLDL